MNIDKTLNAKIPWIMHIDMDAFFASVEQLDDVNLRGKPVVVGGGDRGVVAAASYEARAFGVRSAMPAHMAKKLCPNAIFVRGRMHRYKELSNIVMQALEQYSPMVEPASIDEAYMDAAGLEHLFGPIEEIAQSVQRAVFQATGGLTCSVGAAPIKFLAKIASDVHKPHGFFVLYPQQIDDFLQQLPVKRIPGVGKQFLKELYSLGVNKAGDVKKFPYEFWERRFGKAGISLFARAQGEDKRKVSPLSAAKSESSEKTLNKDTWDKKELQCHLMAQAERVATSLRRNNLRGRVITLKIKYADFTQITRSRTLNHATQSTQQIFDVACDLLNILELAQKVRLIGLGVSGFDIREEQALLPLTSEKDNEKHAKLDGALDSLRERFGSKAVVRGRLFSKK